MIDEIKSRFTIPQIGEEFLPDWKSAKCRRSPFRPDKHPGFSVYDEGRKFTDFATGEHGDVIDFYGLAKGISAPEALNALWDRLRNGTGHSSQAHTEHKSRSSGPTGDDPFALPYHLSVNERKVMRTDCERLLTCQEAIESIASARGWQPDIVRGLALDGVLALSADRCITVNYSSGSKSRWLNANGKRIFCWNFGKPWFWRGDEILQGDIIWIFEGETKAIQALCWEFEPPGIRRRVIALPSASFNPAPWAYLFRAKEVACIADPDPTGTKCAEKIKTVLCPVAQSVAILYPRDLRSEK